jgi:hypothetical protein
MCHKLRHQVSNSSSASDAVSCGLRGSGHLGWRLRLHPQACSSATEIILGLFDPETQSLLEMSRDKPSRTATCGPQELNRSHSLIRVFRKLRHIFQTCSFSAYLRTTSHNPIKTWQQFTTATLSTFTLLYTLSLVQLWKLLAEFAETEKWSKLEACKVRGRLSQSVNRECRYFDISW